MCRPPICARKSVITYVTLVVVTQCESEQQIWLTITQQQQHLNHCSNQRVFGRLAKRDFGFSAKRVGEFCGRRRSWTKMFFFQFSLSIYIFFSLTELNRETIAIEFETPPHKRTKKTLSCLHCWLRCVQFEQKRGRGSSTARWNGEVYSHSQSALFYLPQQFDYIISHRGMHSWCGEKWNRASFAQSTEAELRAAPNWIWDFFYIYFYLF